MLSFWQDEKNQLEIENIETERKLVIWRKENGRLARILDELKDEEQEMNEIVEHCLQRNELAQVCINLYTAQKAKCLIAYKTKKKAALQ